MANPFLFEDVADYGDITSVSSNPFLCGGDEPVNDNPFLTSVSTAPGTNPFADYSWDEPANNDGLLTPPPVTNINDPANNFIASSDDEDTRPRRPPPPRPSMPKETQDLILSVTGALKATSDHLLDRLPPTRAPSPTAFPDLHSPSPTPDLLGGEEDFLSVTQQPARPPPPRPPVRPAPPAVPPARSVPPVQQEDIIDFFGVNPPQQKSKDAILNLYSQPKPQKDLLNDDDDLPLQAPLISSGSTLLTEPILDGTPVVVSETEVISPIESQPAIQAQESPPKQDESSNIFETQSGVSQEVPVPSEPKVESPPLQHENFFNLPDNNIQPYSSSVEPVIDEMQNENAPHSITTEEDSTGIFGSVLQHEETTEIFGVRPPLVDSSPALFGVVPPPVVPTPQTFDAGPLPVEPRAPPPVEPRHFAVEQNSQEPTPQIFGVGPSVPDPISVFGTDSTHQPVTALDSFVSQPVSSFDAFDAFSAKFDQTEVKSGNETFDPFGGSSGKQPMTDAWGSGTATGSGSVDQPGFGGEDTFDAFLSMSQPPPVPQPAPNRIARAESADSEEGGFNVFIKPREGEAYPQSVSQGPVPVLAPPPPKSPAYADNDPKFNPFDKNGQIPAFPMSEGFQLPALSKTEPYEGGFKRSDSQETPPTPLFDEDVSQPLEEFPRIHYSGDGWEMQLRQPNKKKITGQRFWKKIFVKLVYQGDNPVLQLFNLKEDKDPFQELPLQACYSVSEISAQQYDQFGKIFTVKLQYIFYKERPGVRPGQVTKAERITNKLSQFAAYAIQGDYQGCKEFGSDLKKLGLPVEHAPQISQLLKLGCMSYEDLKQFSVTIEECLFHMPVHRDRALTYKMEEVQMTVVDEMFVEQDAYGHVEKQIARVRVFFLAFLSGMPDVELGMNDIWRQGKEVVGRHDIIPVVTEEWIRLENVEFHSCVQLDEYEKTRTIKFKPPDACYIELMRFRIRPPKNRELPLQLKAVMCVTGNKVELRADVLVPGFTSRKLGQIPCEDVMIRFPIPECWIYLFRVEKHFRYGSVKSAHRRTGKIKGIERFLGTVENMEPQLMEVTSGQAKYEHQHRAIVWRMPRLPKEGQGAYTTHNLVCRMQLTSFDQIPDKLAEYAYVEFTMPATTASHTTVRSVSLVDSPSDEPPEKYVRQLARLEYRVGIEHTQGEEMASYIAATVTKPKPPEAPSPQPPAHDSDSDSSG